MARGQRTAYLAKIIEIIADLVIQGDTIFSCATTPVKDIIGYDAARRAMRESSPQATLYLAGRSKEA